MSDILERARALRKKTVELANANMSEAEALEYPELFSNWTEGKSYAAGERVRYDGVLYKVLQDHSAQADWTPIATPSLFAKVLVDTDDGGNQTTVREWEQPDSTNPYSKGDKVLFEGKTYESLIDNNVWSPSAYPAGWQEITE